ncbi:MAG: hypothetical protein H0W86_01010 [Armatimonadetes bacterium]|nr:hypothetical protein [Armatimonadota bacterium]
MRLQGRNGLPVRRSVRRALKQSYILWGATVMRVGEFLVATGKDDNDELRLFLEG